MITPEQIELAEKVAAILPRATPGKWSWGVGLSGRVSLSAPHGGGTVVMDFVRKGMQAAEPRFGISLDSEPRGKRGGILVSLTELVDRDPNGMLDHPDALLIEIARDMAELVSAILPALRWTPIDQHDGSSNPVIIENDNGVVGEAYFHADAQSWYWAQTDPSDHWAAPVNPVAFMPMPKGSKADA